MVKNYESMIIFQPELTDEGLNKLTSKVVEMIEKLGGQVEKAEIWARERNFAYTIRSRGAEKKKYNKGCYWLVYFSLDTEKIGELKNLLRLEEDILRNIIILRKKGGK